MTQNMERQWEWMGWNGEQSFDKKTKESKNEVSLVALPDLAKIGIKLSLSGLSKHLYPCL